MAGLEFEIIQLQQAQIEVQKQSIDHMQVIIAIQFFLICILLGFVLTTLITKAIQRTKSHSIKR